MTNNAPLPPEVLELATKVRDTFGGMVKLRFAALNDESATWGDAKWDDPAKARRSVEWETR